MVRGFGEDISLFSLVKSCFESLGHVARSPAWYEIADGITMLTGMIVPHLFGLLALLSIILLILIKRVPRIVVISHRSILLLMGILFIYSIVRVLIVGIRVNIVHLIFLLIAAVFCILIIPLAVIRTLRKHSRPESPGIIVTFSQRVVASMSFLWFLYLQLWGGIILYGLGLALVSCILIYLGASSFTSTKNSYT